jgi:hypothetical protein
MVQKRSPGSSKCLVSQWKVLKELATPWIWLTSAYPRGWSESPRAPLPKRGLKKVRRGMIADPLGVEHYATRSPDGPVARPRVSSAVDALIRGREDGRS